jgi:hypothetical protein
MLINILCLAEFIVFIKIDVLYYIICYEMIMLQLTHIKNKNRHLVPPI